MNRLAIAMILGVAWCVTVRAADPGERPSEKLADAMENMATLAREAVPLARQELAIVDQKYKGDGYSGLRETIRSQIALAADVGTLEYVRSFREHLAAKHLSMVTNDVVTVIELMQGVAGVMLAEAAAGSPQQERLLKVYQGDELALVQLGVVHRDWQSHVNSK